MDLSILEQYAECIKDAYCHGCGNTEQHVHVFHFADERVATNAGPGTLMCQLCKKCHNDSRGTEKGYLIDTALIPRSQTGEDIPSFMKN